MNNSTDVLLDFEAVHGQGVYYPEMEEPEYCNASATSLWELLPLEVQWAILPVDSLRFSVFESALLIFFFFF